MILALDLLSEIWLRFLADDKQGLQYLVYPDFDFLDESKQVKSVYDFTDEGLLDPQMFKFEVKKLHNLALENKSKFKGFNNNL